MSYEEEIKEEDGLDFSFNKNSKNQHSNMYDFYGNYYFFDERATVESKKLAEKSHQQTSDISQRILMNVNGKDTSNTLVLENVFSTPIKLTLKPSSNSSITQTPSSHISFIFIIVLFSLVMIVVLRKYMKVASRL